MRVLITGGAGSFGQALVRRFLANGSSRIVVYSRDEYKHAMMDADLGEHAPLRFFVGDVRDRDRLEEAMWGIEVVIHAAALKRVDSVAYNPSEVRKTNIEGSANVTAAAIAAGVGRVLMISSDKAVEPQNTYGVSKAQMEAEAIAMNAMSVPRGTRIACTRWGNVIGSRGSVVHIFEQAVADGMAIPITNPDCTRFWLSLDDAASFALFALHNMKGGEIFVPFLPAMLITALAEAIAPGWPTRIVGLRPGGEKLHESLLSQDEIRRTLSMSSGDYLVQPALHPWVADPPWQGEPMPEGFQYVSDKPNHWLSVEEMREMLK